MDRKNRLASLGPVETPDQKILDQVPSRKDIFAGLPDRSASPKTIEDSKITYNKTPHWRALRVRLDILNHKKDQTSINPLRSIKSVSISGFAHIDENRHGMGNIAANTCSTMADTEAAIEWMTKRREVLYGPVAVSSSCMPLSGPLFEKGPYDLAISKDRNDFMIHITAENIEETVKISMSVAEIRRRTVSYAELTADKPAKDSNVFLRKDFETERENQHDHNAAYIGEKFAQQGWHIGYRQARLLFELSSYLVSPQLHNQPDFDTGLRHS